MSKDYDADLIAQELGRVSGLGRRVRALSEKVDGTQLFHFISTRIMTTEEMVSICRDMAAVIRREIPERPDGWAASIHAEQYGTGDRMGIYRIGWVGHADKWHLHEGQGWTAADRADWLTLLGRLHAVLIALGRTEGERAGSDGDFFLERTEDGRHQVELYIHQPEFLTIELVAAIQNVLRDGYASWLVDVSPAFGPPFEKLFRGIYVRANGMEEKWNRREVKRMLGERLKI